MNYTFRSTPTEKLLNGWIEATPPGFLFTIKAHQRITHIKRLKDAGLRTRCRFVSSLEPLRAAGKLGPVLFQLPPFLKCDLPRLEEFLAALPRPLRAAFEFRHESWFNDAVFDALRKANAALCEAESEKLEAPHVQTADFSYLRLRKETYPAKTLKQLTGRVKELAQSGISLVCISSTRTPPKAPFQCAETLLASGRMDLVYPEMTRRTTRKHRVPYLWQHEIIGT